MTIYLKNESFKKQAVIIDLDGTLCNIDHRKHYIEGDVKDWKSFNEDVTKDKVNIWCRELVRSLYICNIQIIYVTGREGTQKTIENTAKWLNKNGCSHCAHIFFRKEKDYRPDYVIKKEIYDLKINYNYDVLFAVDDRKQVVNMWRELGLTCLQCDEGDY